MLNRRDALWGAAAIGGAGLLRPLAPWLEPLADGALSARRGAFAVTEVEAVEHVVSAFRDWHSPGSGLGRTAVVGQLSDVAERLRDAPAGALTDRVFLGGAELAKMAASMAFDEGLHRIAQQHYVTAVVWRRQADTRRSARPRWPRSPAAFVLTQMIDLPDAARNLWVSHRTQATGDHRGSLPRTRRSAS